MLERRQELRARSMFKSAYVRTEHGLEFVTLRNISESGVCLDAYAGIVEGEEVEFCIDSTGLRRGRVRWIKDGLCGILASDIDEQESSIAAFPPRAVRLPLSLAVHLYIEGRRTEAILRNISIRGACISSRSELVAGQLVSVGISGYSFELATVRWVDRNLFGLRFAEPIHPGVFRELVAKIQKAPDRERSAREVQCAYSQEGDAKRRAYGRFA